MQNLMYLEKKGLLCAAGVVWLAAGINVANIGVEAYANEHFSLPLLLALLVGTALVYALFWFMIFSKLLNKHTQRIFSYQNAQPFWHFFDTQAFVIMAIMMTVGISLRVFSLVPEWFIASFYTGLGIALMQAGAGFLLAFLRERAK